MQLTIPDFCLVVLVGPSGAGKTHFARTHFKPTEVIASDACRALVCDDETDQAATADAFELLRFIATKRLAARRLTVIDATNVRREDRKALLELARAYHALAVAIVFNLPENLCQERNRQRPERPFGRHVIRLQTQQLRHSLRGLQREGFRYVYMLDSPDAVEAATIARQRLWQTAARSTGRSTLSAISTGALTNSAPCWISSATLWQWSATLPARRSTGWRIPTAAGWSFWATWSIVDRAFLTYCAWPCI
jgi:protein phosphatase